MPQSYRQKVYDIAEDQHGYLTVAQAQAVGVPAIRLVQMVKEGSLERVSRGVYRLMRFPVSALDQFMEATLWPQVRRPDVQGVLSHESALVFHGISDVSPSKVHIAVPPTIRIRRAIPKHLVVHHVAYAPADVARIDGVVVTTPDRTIRDVAAAHMRADLVRGAIEDGRRIGCLTGAQAERLVADLLNHEADVPSLRGHQRGTRRTSR